MCFIKKSLYQYTLLCIFLFISAVANSETVNRDRSPIQIWYGVEQEFGQNGLAQNWINILGTVWKHQSNDKLSYQLDGGVFIPLTVGKTKRRLVRTGDFNIDIEALPLLEKIPPGGSSQHEILIKLTRASRPPVQKTVAFTLHRPEHIPEYQQVDFSNVSNLQQTLQITDGAWAIHQDRLHAVIPGYDRIIALGSRDWRDMEVEFDVEILAIDEAGFEAPSNGPGLGVVLRWQGHHDWNKAQPAIGWWPFGAIGMFRWRPNWQEPRFIIMGNKAKLLAFDETGQGILPEKKYRIKMQVITESDNRSKYRLKYWQTDMVEPVEWLLEAYGDEDDLKQGGVAIIAHHLLISIGKIKVKRLG